MKKNTPIYSVSLVIPVYNNANTAVEQINICLKVLKSITNDFEILISDDASQDDTVNLLKKAFLKDKRVTIAQHKSNQGIAKNVYGLYKKAKKEYIVLFSVDGDWEPQDIKNMLLVAWKNNADIVIGHRKIKNYTMKRKIISSAFNRLPKILFGIETYDAGSIKVIKKQLFNKTALRATSVFFEAELIIKASKNGAKVMTCPITFRKKDKTSGSGGNLKLVMASVRDMIVIYLKDFILR
jgi:glycosyltransferase involved in cell wall biosynthesis